MRLNFQFDGTGLYGYSLCHGALKNASYSGRASQHSERLLETLFVAHAGDGHASMMNIVGDWAPPRGATPDAKCLAVQASKLIAAGEYTFDGVTFPLELCVSADHKGVESFRGCGHCSPWCICADDEKHAVPFDGDLAKIAAADYPATVAEMARVCKYPVSRELSSPPRWGTPPERPVGCPWCTSKRCATGTHPPYASKSAWVAADAACAKVVSEAKTPQQKAAAARLRTEFARQHLHQKRGEKFLFPVASMALVPVELLHHLYLNLPKMLFKWLIRRHWSHKSRFAAMDYFTSIGCGIDLKTKEEGRKEEKWFRGDAWQRVVEGTDKNPGGLATVITHLVGLMGQDLPQLSEAEQRRNAAATERRRAAGEQFDETEALLNDTWGKVTAASCSLLSAALTPTLQSTARSTSHGMAKSMCKRCGRLGLSACSKLPPKWASTWRREALPTRAGLCILPNTSSLATSLTIALLLWRFSSGALEQRGAQLKRIGSCVACFRPLAKGPKGPWGQVHNSCAVQQIMEVNNARQLLASDPASVRFQSRGGKALISGLNDGTVGRMTKQSGKTKSRLQSVCDEQCTSSSAAFVAHGI